MKTSTDQPYENNSSFLYIGHIPVEKLRGIKNKSGVHNRVVVHTPDGDGVVSEANRKRIKELVPRILEAVRALTPAILQGKTALVIREEAHGGQNIFGLE